MQGPFDPVTIGHTWMIEQGSRLFDELIVGIGDNPAKKPMFSIERRIKMIKNTLMEYGFTNVTVSVFTKKLLINHARENNAGYILRGMRDTNDFNYETGLLQVNEKIDPNIQTVFLIPPAYLREVSSSVVKSLIGFEGWENITSKYVSPSVMQELITANDFNNKGDSI
jgi:pantetheine-phosphate adenylyltransferase